MPEIDHATKQRLKLCGRSLADLARALGLPYQTVSAHTNGYTWANAELQRRIGKQLVEWEQASQGAKKHEETAQ